MNLIVVESPTKARTLSRFLGNDYIVEATMGHIKDLPKKTLAVDIRNNFRPNFILVEDKRKIVKKLEFQSQKAKVVYLATDPDREGEAIAWHVYEVLCKEKGTKNCDSKLRRIVFHEITKEAVEEAIKNPREIDTFLVDAQVARRILDRLVGYKLSPLLWKKVRRGLSAGRVQSVAVRLIVEREREIESFVPQEYWEIFAGVSKKPTKKESFIVKLVKINSNPAEIKNQKEAEEIVRQLQGAVYRVKDVRIKEVNKAPYPPFTTSTMTQVAARFLGWSAKKTMSIAQRLYEEGLITYHRTDSVNLAAAAVFRVREFISKNYGKIYLPQSPRVFKRTSKLAQEAHEAIRPTDVEKISIEKGILDKRFARDCERLYQLIWKRFVACQMSDYIYDERIVDVEARSDFKGKSLHEYLLRASGKTLKFDGWRKVIPLSKDEEPELPLVKKDDVLFLIKVFSEQKFTQPPPRYSEATLIKTLENLGIGRPSTYAPIISTIKTRNYVEKEEGKFKPTPIGIAVNDFLVQNFPDIVDYPFTAGMEEKLDDIAKGKLIWYEMLDSFYKPFEKKLEDVERSTQRVKIKTLKLGKKCTLCQAEGRIGDRQGELVVRTGKFGKFISCSNFPECKYTEKFIERTGQSCPECGIGEVVVNTTKNGKRFYGCSQYPKCKWASWKRP